MKATLAALTLIAVWLLVPSAAHATPTCITHPQLNQVQVNDTMAWTENVTFNGVHGSVNETPHLGDGGVWYFESRWYDECNHPPHGGQIAYRMPAGDYPSGVWHVKAVAYY